jgi:predicted N-acetyltransferase YhbS
MTYALNISPNAFSPASVLGWQVVETGPAIRVLDEAAVDVGAREALLDAAFGPARAEKTCERLREGRRPAHGLSIVAKDGVDVVGTLRLWHIAAGPGRPALLLGPLAVARSHRARGLGTRLISEALFRAVVRGHGAVLLVGDAPYYERFGFDRRFTTRLVMPGFVEKERFLGLELAPDALAAAAGPVTATGPLDVPALAPQAAELLRAA